MGPSFASRMVPPNQVSFCGVCATGSDSCGDRLQLYSGHIGAASPMALMIPPYRPWVGGPAWHS